MARKIFIVLLGCWALVVSAALIRFWNDLREVDELRSRQEQFEALLLKQSEIISVNTVIMQALVQRVRDSAEPVEVKPHSKLRLYFGGEQNDE